MAGGLSGRAVWFAGPGRVEVREEPVAVPAAGEVLVETVCSAISAGTELLVLRGEAPADLAVDAALPAFAGAGAFRFPLRYGYAAAGRVIGLGESVAAGWLGRLVFALQPHGSHFTTATAELQSVPAGIEAEDAVLLANMETAVNLALDGAPLLGERVAVIGQGSVGLLLTGLLARFPLASLVTFDHYPLRREQSLALGAGRSLDPAEPGTHEVGWADLVYEVSGRPAALDLAVALAGYEGRIVVGSWYGAKRASVDLGGRFHRERLRLVSSQVSTIAPALRGRWDAARRFGAAWDGIRTLRPARLITHRFPVERAAEAYELLGQRPETALQVCLTYLNGGGGRCIRWRSGAASARGIA